MMLSNLKKKSMKETSKYRLPSTQQVRKKQVSQNQVSRKSQTQPVEKPCPGTDCAPWQS